MENIEKLKELAKDMIVLYVEDEDDIRKKTLDILKIFFAQVDFAVNGKDGINQYKEFQEQTGKSYDLIITDIAMPYMDGIEMCKKIYSQNKDQFVMVMTAYNDLEILETLIEIGIDGFIQKPLSVESFLQKLTKVVNLISLYKQQQQNIQEIEKLNKQLQDTNKNLEIQIEQRTQKFKEQLFIDSLTNAQTYAALIKTKSEKNFHVLFLIDIHGFSQINNLYGYEFGNKILQSFVECLNEFNKDKEYTLYRISSDRFAFYEADQMEKVFSYEEDLHALKTYIESYSFVIDEVEVKLSAAIGLSVGQDDPVVTADMALSSAKKNQIGIQAYNSDIDVLEQVSKNLDIRDKIVEAVKTNEVFPVFHPIMDTKGDVIKYEVLMRIADYSSGEEQVLYPDQFLHLAMQSKQYNNLCKTLFEKTFEMMEKSDKSFSINLSYDDIYNSVIINYLEENLEKYPAIGKRLIIEILETQSIEQQNMIDKFFKFTSKYGVKVAIDDFGTGYSNFSHILMLNPDYIKIDGVFIKDILTNKESQVIVESIVYFAKKLGIKVIAEYVHSKEVFEWTKSVGIDEFQGYYFSEPLRDVVE